MKRMLLSPPSRLAVAALLAAAATCTAQQSLTWEQVKSEFESKNPALKADALNVDEMRAEEITAYLRPNPQFTASADGTQIAPHDGVWQPFKGTDVVPSLSYLHERDHKRELRLESAKEGTRE
jgi:cobalt-zinc-cadmium efflux system outer membrane protein